jgi:hypothetical protein
MPDHVIDTNVLLVASAAHPFSPFSDSHVPPEHRETVLNWLVAFKSDKSRKLVLDMTMEIYNEYRNKLGDQDLGLQIIHERMADAEWVEIETDQNGHGVVPADLDTLDYSDRKFAAAALAAPGPTTIVNCADSDWLDVADGCAAVGIHVEQLLDAWLRATHAAR